MFFLVFLECCTQHSINNGLLNVALVRISLITRLLVKMIQRYSLREFDLPKDLKLCHKQTSTCKRETMKPESSADPGLSLQELVGILDRHGRRPPSNLEGTSVCVGLRECDPGGFFF